MTPILKEIHWLPVRHCIVYKILSLIYKAINGAVPGYICDLLNYCTSKGTLRSSVQYPLATPKARLKTYGERTFPVASRFMEYLRLKLASYKFQFYLYIPLKNISK